MKVNVCMTGLGGRGVDDGDEESPLKTEERRVLVPVLTMSSRYGRWPIGDWPRELALRFNPERGADDGAGTGASNSSGGGDGDGDTGATY